MRKDERYTWTKDEDMQLVETILRHVRKGGSAIDGCREYAEVTNGEHSVEANKFRFHTKLKDQYSKAYELAKAEGKKVKQAKRKPLTQIERLNTILLEKSNEQSKQRKVELDDIMVMLKAYMKQEGSTETDSKLLRENEKLSKQVKELRESNLKLSKAFNDMEQDYKELRSALLVLKKAGLSIDIPQPTSTLKYTVDANGLVHPVE